MDIKILASSSAGNCYTVSDGETLLMIECGIPIREIKQKLNFGLGGVKGCLVSHAHLDHCKAWKDVAKASIDLYMSRGTAEARGATGHRINIIEAKRQFDIGSMAVLPFEIEHDAPEPLGFLIYSRTTGEKLLFATDTYYCRYMFKGLTRIMLECNYAPDILQNNIEEGITNAAMRDRLLESHFSLPNVKKFLLANDLSQVKEIHLIHLSNDNSDAERFRREIREITGLPVYVA